MKKICKVNIKTAHNNGYIIRLIMYKNDDIYRRYSENFKLKILSELSTGKYNKRQLGRIYEIQNSTINEWIKKHNRTDLINTRINVETKDKTIRIKAFQKEVEQLKNAIEIYNNKRLHLSLGYKTPNKIFEKAA